MTVSSQRDTAGADRPGSVSRPSLSAPSTARNRTERLALSCVIEGGEPAVAEVTVVSGAAAAWQQVCEGGFGEGLAGRAATLDLDQVLARAARSRCRFVVPGDDEWPERIGDLRYCDEVQRRGGVPFGLWLRGPGHLAQLTERSVAVVGSRTATPYGTTIATDLGAELAESGFTVISGGAYGIDTAAHQGALAAGGPTIAVVANGVDVAYPQGNRRLFDCVGENGLIVSELAPGTHPSRVRFLIRTLESNPGEIVGNTWSTARTGLVGRYSGGPIGCRSSPRFRRHARSSHDGIGICSRLQRVHLAHAPWF